VYAFGVGGGDAHVNAPERALRQSVARQLLPGHAAVRRAIQATAGTAAGEIPRLPPGLPQRRVHDARIAWIEADVDGAGLLVLVEHLGPRLAAVDRAEDTALGVRTEGMPESRHQHDIRIVRIDDECADLPRVFEADVAPGLAAIGRPVDAVPI